MKTWMITAITVVVICTSSGSSADMHFDDGGQHIINFNAPEDVYVDFNNAPNPGTQVTLALNGTIHDDLLTHNNSRVFVTDGSIGNDIRSFNNSRVTITGGTIGGDLWVHDDSQVIIAGGTIGMTLDVAYNGLLTIWGTDFAIDGSDVDYGEIIAGIAGSHLTGILDSGEVIDNDFFVRQTASIILIPEPATFFLLLVGGVGLVRRRKKRGHSTF